MNHNQGGCVRISNGVVYWAHAGQNRVCQVVCVSTAHIRIPMLIVPPVFLGLIKSIGPGKAYLRALILLYV